MNKRHGVLNTHQQVIYFLFVNRKAISIFDLSVSIAVTYACMHTNVKQLSKIGIIEVGKKDNRTKSIKLTPKGLLLGELITKYYNVYNNGDI